MSQRPQALPDRGRKLAASELKVLAANVARAHDPARFLGVADGLASLAELVEAGLPTTSAECLAGHLQLPAGEFASRYASIPRQTLARRRTEGRLNVFESDRVARFARLLDLATDMMEGDTAAALRWLKTPMHILGGHPPLEHARTETGAVEVEQLIGRIEHGVVT